MGNAVTSGEKAYEIKLDKEHKLGAGSFAEVYKIKARATGQIYAGKFFKCQIGHMGLKDQLGF